eukprot:350001-Chlamydomonas_euryale.AAC.5
MLCHLLWGMSGLAPSDPFGWRRLSCPELSHHTHAHLPRHGPLLCPLGLLGNSALGHSIGLEGTAGLGGMPQHACVIAPQHADIAASNRTHPGLDGALDCMAGWAAWHVGLHGRLGCMAHCTAWQAGLYGRLGCMACGTAWPTGRHWDAGLHGTPNCMAFVATCRYELNATPLL